MLQRLIDLGLNEVVEEALKYSLSFGFHILTQLSRVNGHFIVDQRKILVLVCFISIRLFVSKAAVVVSS